ncbi:MAG: guanylate kinase [Acidobacteriota bacterium]
MRQSEATGQGAGDRGELFILSAPSATGKTTLIRRLLSRYGELAERMAFSVSHTTRPPRTGEIPGEHYYFVSRDEFEQMIADDAFLEWARVHGRFYGTSRAEIERLRRSGRDVILDIDVQGAHQILRREPEIPAIFILPPSYEEMERRLRSRALDDDEQITTRLRNAAEELLCYEAYEYVIVNDDLDRACEALAAIFLACRSRRDRMQSQIDRVLTGFPLPEHRSSGGSQSD